MALPLEMYGLHIPGGDAMEVYGGRIAEIDPQSTTFVHRNSYGDLFVDSFYHPEWPYNTREDAERWLRETMEVIDRHSNGRRYQNCPGHGLENPMDAYFGENLGRLRNVKEAYDPESFFRFEQSIPPAE